MPYCPTCGFKLDENMAFCPKCGTPLKNQFSAEKTAVQGKNGDVIKPKTILANGIIIGSGIALLLIGLIAVFALNSTYVGLRGFLSSDGLPSNAITFTLRDTVELISLSFVFAALGAYFLIIGLLNQFSRRARTSWKRKDIQARIGNGLMTGGFVLGALSASGYVRLSYNSELGGLGIFSSLMLAGIIMWAAGLILLLTPRHNRP
jgi:hypothetical protein